MHANISVQAYNERFFVAAKFHQQSPTIFPAKVYPPGIWVSEWLVGPCTAYLNFNVTVMVRGKFYWLDNPSQEALLPLRQAALLPQKPRNVPVSVVFYCSKNGRFFAASRPTDLELCAGAQHICVSNSQSANPFVVRPSQLHIALGVDHGGMAQPFLQDGDRNPSQDAVAAVGVPQGAGVGPGRVYPYLDRRLFHHLADPLAREGQHRLVPVLAVERCQVAKTFHQISWHRDLPALARLAAGRVGLDHDDRRLLVQAEVHTPQRQGLSDTRRPVLSMIRKAMRVG